MAVKINVSQIKSLLKEKKVGRHAIGNGLYFRISKEGTGFWAVRYTIHGKRREVSIGKHSDMTLAEAISKAADIKLEIINNNIDPIAEKKRGDVTEFKIVEDLAEDWLKDCDKRLKHSKIPRRVYRKDIASIIGELAIDKVNPRDIRAIINRIAESDRPTVANDALMYCKQMFRHAVKLDLRQTNPAEAFSVGDAGGAEQSRSRALSLEELGKVFKCLRENKDQFTRENYLAVALLVTLGVRKGELIAAKWGEFDLNSALWDIPTGRSKTGVAITVSLPKIAVDWLKELEIRACGSEYVFPSRRASKRRGYISDDTLNHALAKLFGQKVRPGEPPANKMGEVGIEHFTIHDLRRTCRSLLAELKVPGHVAERCLNHKLKGVEGIYDRYDYFDERKKALEKLAGVLGAVI